MSGVDLYTIVRDPVDMPGVKFVARHWIAASDASGEPVRGEIVGTADTLEEIRTCIPWRADYRIERDPSDDPHIVETWI